MTPEPQLLNSLDRAGEALRALGEDHVLIGYYRPTDAPARFSLRLELEGTTGIHGSGDTPAAAYADACAKRGRKMRELELQRRVDAEVRRQLEEEAGREVAACLRGGP